MDNDLITIDIPDDDDVLVNIGVPVTATGVAASFCASLAEAGVDFRFTSATIDGLPEDAVGSPPDVVADVISVVSAAGGLSGLAAALKVFFDRNKVRQ